MAHRHRWLNVCVRPCCVLLLVLAPLIVVLPACNPAQERAGAGSTPVAGQPDPEIEAIAGTYRVEGVTVQSNRGALREVSGTITLRAQPGGYAAEIALTTLYPTEVAKIPAEISGTATGRLVGSHLVGSAETSLRPAAGVSLAGTGGAPPEDLVVRSSSVATVDENGRLEIQIQNEPQPGEDYAPSITVLAGVRDGSTGAAPEVASGPLE